MVLIYLIISLIIFIALITIEYKTIMREYILPIKFSDKLYWVKNTLPLIFGIALFWLPIIIYITIELKYNTMRFKKRIK